VVGTGQPAEVTLISLDGIAGAMFLPLYASVSVWHCDDAINTALGLSITALVLMAGNKCSVRVGVLFCGYASS